MCHEQVQSLPLPFFVVSLLFASPAGSFADAEARQPVVLLLPGIKLDLRDRSLGFGEPSHDREGNVRWTGMISALQEAGLKFGGVIRPRGADLSLPRCLDTTYVPCDPRQASLFVLDYSSAANVDGLAYKTLELAESVKQLRSFTQCTKVRIVAYSAGGLVARTYLQSALPRVAYAGDVERLITIATPHLGSTQAEHFGDFLGTRATALRPSSDLIRRLNDELELPPDVDYASIVVRGMQIGSRRIHEIQEDSFGRFVDRAQIGRLPLDFQKGCDQVVNVWSQNLALARCARRYEEQHGRPIQYLLARVTDPSPDDLLPFDDRVHDVAANDRVVIGLVNVLLNDRGFWTGLPNDYRTHWLQWQARNCAFGVIEDAMAKNHRFSEVFYTNVFELTEQPTRDGNLRFRFAGLAKSKWRLPPRIRSSTTFAGTMDLKVDQFGRVTECRFHVAKQ